MTLYDESTVIYDEPSVTYDGLSITDYPLDACVLSAEIEIAGTVVANPDFSAQPVGATSFIDGVGRTWTITDVAIEESGFSDAPYRRLVKVGTVDGPLFGEPIGRSCTIQEVSFQLAAGNPYLFSRPITFLDQTVNNGETACTSLGPGEWQRLAVRITLEQLSSGSSGSVQVIATPIDTDESCDDAGDYNPCVDYSVATVLGRVQVIDARDQSISYYSRQTEETGSALGDLTFDGPFQWLELEPCSALCLCISPTGQDVSVKVEAFFKDI